MDIKAREIKCLFNNFDEYFNMLNLNILDILYTTYVYHSYSTHVFSIARKCPPRYVHNTMNINIIWFRFLIFPHQMILKFLVGYHLGPGDPKRHEEPDDIAR